LIDLIYKHNNKKRESNKESFSHFFSSEIELGATLTEGVRSGGPAARGIGSGADNSRVDLVIEKSMVADVICWQQHFCDDSSASSPM
jgi:hypothetical protein